MGARVYDKPSDITAEGGEVQIDGPGATAISMSPNAARRTADRLKVGAGDAQAQRDGDAGPDVASVQDIPPDTLSL